MQSCLGIYVESNIVKYAKLSKERDNLKIDSFGIKFYDKLGETLKQIIDETYSYKIPISINLSEEMYNYFYMFSLLSKNDLKKAITTEFDSQCFDKGINRNALEARYALASSLEDKEKIKVIHVSSNKNSISTIEQQFEGSGRVSTISPIGISIANTANLNLKENVLIVNLEEKTIITTVVEQKVYNIEKLDIGSKDVLDEIATKENSYVKSYEICKNSTIYTMEGKELQEDENVYLENIMPTLYKIVSKVKDIVGNSTIKYEKIYITGTLAVVNNIDLYFQEFFNHEKCEILKPFFIKDNIKINIKDFIEVNSAIALAMQGLGYGIKEMNFKKANLKDSLINSLNVQMPKKGDGKTKLSGVSFNLSNFLKLDWKSGLDATERWLLRTAGGVLVLVIIYSAFSMFLNSEIVKKQNEVEDVKQDTAYQISSVNTDTNLVKDKTNRYIQLSDNLKNISKQIQEDNKKKNNVPTLLTKIMFAMPQGVQITAIENTTGNHVVINAQSNQYQQLGYFKAILKEEGILLPSTIVSSSGTKTGDTIQVIIEGDMP